MQINGSNELVEKVQKQGLCINCGACAEICPYFKSHRGEAALVFPCTLTKGQCFAHCPKVEVDYDVLNNAVWGEPYVGSPIGHHIEVLAARAGDNMRRENVQSGGTVTALMSFAMQEGMIDAAALTDRDGLDPVAMLATSVEEVQQCSGSKFMSSPAVSALNLGIRKGYKRIGFVGTSCQAVAVAQLQQNPLDKENFENPVALSIGLFCNWSLDMRALQDVLEEKLDIGKIKGMDIPPPPAELMVLKTDQGDVEVSLHEIKPLIPETCWLCMDMTAEYSDVSVGMYEGRPGWNTLIVRSQRGADLVARAVAAGVLETETFPQENLDGLSNASASKKERSLRMLLKKGLVNAEDEEASCVARIPEEIVEKILK